MFSTTILLAAAIAFLPYLAAAFFGNATTAFIQRLPLALRLCAPALLCLPYLLVSLDANTFNWGWLALYALMPQAIAILLWQASRVDTSQRGNWRDYLVVAFLGLTIDLHWFTGAWPVQLAFLNKILLVNAGIYGILLMRRLDGVGFDLRVRLRDLGIGLREFAVYAPIAIALGLVLGFLHPHAPADWLHQLPIATAFTFFTIAVPEELYFRGWVQNLFERRIGRNWALAVTAILFGLAHFNKGATVFNWKYVLLATLAGIYYGRAWRSQRRVAASAITHTAIDVIWSIWFK